MELFDDSDSLGSVIDLLLKSETTPLEQQRAPAPYTGFDRTGVHYNTFDDLRAASKRLQVILDDPRLLPSKGKHKHAKRLSYQSASSKGDDTESVKTSKTQASLTDEALCTYRWYTGQRSPNDMAYLLENRATGTILVFRMLGDFFLSVKGLQADCHYLQVGQTL